MNRFVISLFVVAGIMLGCAQNHFNIPADTFSEKVKVLGVAPIFIDADSDIIYPQKEFLLPLIAELNLKYEQLLVRKLQSTGNFSAVTLLADEPGLRFSSLVARREKRDDAGIQYNKYFWKNDEIGTYIKKNRLDAVMLVVVSGLTKSSKIYSSNLLDSLETDFNFLTMTAQILGPDGTVLWEYPNFRTRLLTYYPLVNLQYPDFSETEANLSKRTELRFKSIDGIRRTLEQKKRDWLHRETQEPEVYGRLFDEMASLIKHDNDNQTKGGVVVDRKSLPLSDGSLKPAELPVQSAVPGQSPVLAPAAETPVQASAEVPAAEKAVKAPDTPSTGPIEIVPATGSTR
ncbi:MAG: hypothetical protein HIU83_02980 [Proteobacteria bacterium]|nr:hypothetical protein [Pseudomonadota bacterium]